jgi:hypothetical protein
MALVQGLRPFLPSSLSCWAEANPLSLAQPTAAVGRPLMPHLAPVDVGQVPIHRGRQTSLDDVALKSLRERRRPLPLEVG